MIRLMVAGALLALTACTAVNVRSVGPQALGNVCIVNNPAVIVDDFVDVVRDGFDRHGIATSLVASQSTPGCTTTLTYTALRSWDFAPYLTRAELRLWQGGHQVGYAEYHLRGKGGFALTKWQGTHAKMDPVIDALLKDAAPGQPSLVAMPAPTSETPAAPAAPSTVPLQTTSPTTEPDPAKRCDACQQIGKNFK
jgi:hypothetical protein